MIQVSMKAAPKVKQQTSLGVSVVVLVLLSVYFLRIDTVISVEAGGSKTSELNLDKRGLSIIPTDQLCATQVREPFGRINVASFANNQIKRIEANAFSCIALVLKILILRFNEIESLDNEAFARLSTVLVLLLDNNRLSSIPSKQVLRHLTELRHLNLANNKIVSLQSDSFGSESKNLISLNLKGNPLHSISSNSLLQLVKLKTLTLSQSSLSGLSKPLDGLTELRFFNLDRAQNLTRVPSDLCQISRKLSSLVIKSNQIDRIPRFTQCQTLLLLDLSYNKITGSLSYGDFLNQPNLIDLYLGFNQIQSIDERALVGLKKLQVLELNNNNLKQIHSNAFIPIQTSIYELNLSNNNRLTSIPSIGLEKLVSFKSFGNEQLRQLPIFKSAKSLALTYAYHCCDYFPSNVVHYSEKQESSELKSGLTALETPLMTQLINSILVKLQRIFANNNNKNESQTNDGFPTRLQEGSNKNLDSFEENLTHLDNFTELVIWPQVGLDLNSKSEADSRSGRRRKRHNHHHHHHHHHNRHRSGRNLYNNALQPRDTTFFYSELSGRGPTSVSETSDLIDGSLDLILQEVRQIRIAHQVWMPLKNSQVESMLSGSIATRLKRHLLLETTIVSELSAQNLIDKNQSSSQDTAFNSPVRCLPKPSAFFPCQDLFDTWWLRVGIWSVFLLAFTGNILVIIVLSLVRPSSATSALTSIMWLAHSKRHIDVPRFLVINLAVADLFMSIYLGLLAFVDLSTLGEFKLFAIKWQYSSGCKLAGFLGVLSSELSVFILAIITLERNYAITNAVHLNRRLSLQKAIVIMFIGYTFALSMAIMPLNGISDYRKFSICLPLDIDSNLSSQIYIISLIAINTFSFLLLISCYLRMYCAIRGSQAWNTNDLRIAKRMSILVITDFLCWIPIIIVAVSTLFGYHLIGTNGIKILTIFILPLNSVANPFLYAITTKKFKRDLDTLIRRTRSGVRNRIHICYKGDDRLEDPKIFIGNYNEYQHNLMLNQKKQNKKNLLANEFVKHQQQHQMMMMINKKNEPRKYHKQEKFNYQLNTRPFNHCTANQVTINRTSCSCQRNHLQDEQSLKQHQQQPSLNGGSSIVVQVNAHKKPRIVLDSAEADSFNRDQIKEDIIGAMRNSSSNSYIKNQDLNNSKCLNTFEERNSCRFYDGSCLRPKSDEICDRGQPTSCPIGSSCHAIIDCQFETHGNDLNVEFNDRSKHRFLGVSDNIQQQDQDRSASACGYSTISKKDKVNHSHTATKVASTCDACIPHHKCNIKDTKVCGSYDTIQIKKDKETYTKGSNEKLSQSINRLLFSPIAKAWSSIQISLSSSASHVAAIATGKQSSSRLDDQEEQSASAATTTTTPKKELTNNSTTIEEMLLLSSPSTRYQFSERRMSKSCDLVPQQQNQICFVSPSSSEAGGGSSQCDYDDDQRILLATINRIAANRESAKRRKVNQDQDLNNDDCINDIDNEEIYHHNGCLNENFVNDLHSDRQCDTNHQRAKQYQQKHSRSSKQRFNRCRSWSPALLSKLEDCIHQIKHRIPGFNPNNNTKDERIDGHNLHYQVVPELTTHDLSDNYHGCCSNVDVDGPLVIEQNSGVLCCISNQHSNQRGDESDLNEDYDNDMSEIDAANDGDVFDEKAIDEWAQKRKNLFRKRHAGRLSNFQHQSSTNSDTLSTRTGATIVTNMSISFDDATTNSPNTNQLNSTVQHLHSVDEGSENQITVEQDKNEPKREQ